MLSGTGHLYDQIIILGAGRVGESVAESLVSEQNDITVIDQDPERLRQLEEEVGAVLFERVGGHSPQGWQQFYDAVDQLANLTRDERRQALKE